MTRCGFWMDAEVASDASGNSLQDSEPDVAATSYPCPPDMRSPTEQYTKMLNTLIPGYSTHMSQDVEPDCNIVELRQKKKGSTPRFCTYLPPSAIEPRCSDAPVAANKTVWIIHPLHPQVVAAAGKTGVSWKSKANKLGPLCQEGTQWVFIHRVFIGDVAVMYPDPDVGVMKLSDSQYPSTGKQKPIKWDSKYLVQYQAPMQT